jgi:hypothetical protein
MTRGHGDTEKNLELETWNLKPQPKAGVIASNYQAKQSQKSKAFTQSYAEAAHW